MKQLSETYQMKGKCLDSNVVYAATGKISRIISMWGQSQKLVRKIF